MNQIFMVIMAAGAVVGGIDRILGNKWGYGEKFEEGFQFLGSTALSMAGMICLAPTLTAFLVSAASMLAAHMGFTLRMEPQLLGALIGAKMCGGVAAVLAALGVCVLEDRKFWSSRFSRNEFSEML